MNWSRYVPFLIFLTFNYTYYEQKSSVQIPLILQFGTKSIPNISLLYKIYTSIYSFTFHQRLILIFEDPKIGFGTGQDLVKIHLFSPFYSEENQVTVLCSGLKTTAAVSLFDHKMTQPILRKKSFYEILIQQYFQTFEQTFEVFHVAKKFAIAQLHKKGIFIRRNP